MSEPALRDGVIASEHDRVVCQPCSDASSRACLAADTIGAERACPCVQAPVAVAQEPRRLRPPLQRLGLFTVRERALERRLGLVPCAAAERRETCREAALSRDVADPRSRGRLWRQLERRILVEDQSLQPTHLEGWLEAEIVVQPAAELLIDRERVGVAAGSVEREPRLPV